MKTGGAGANLHLLMLRAGGETRTLAIRQIRAALKARDGAIPAAAADLRCSERVLYRILVESELSEEAARLRHAAGLLDTRNAHRFS